MNDDITGVVQVAVDEREVTAPITKSTRLTCIAGVDLGRTFRIATTVVIGRGSGVEVQLRATDISRSHARIIVHDRGFLVEDLGSSNGTLLNNARISGAVPLQIGDRIRMGTTILVLTHHDELEDRMRQLQRLDAMTTLAAGLAHDFNNALQVIAGSLHYFEDRASFDKGLREVILEMQEATANAAGLAKRLMRLGRPDPVTFETVKLPALVDRAVGMMRRLAGDTISISIEMPADLSVRGSHGELHQVLHNLFLNSRDAMPDGGRFTITAQVVHFDLARAHAEHLEMEGDYIDLRITDTGSGMDEIVLARAFDPFFTTKAAGKGTGLGLAMIHGIIRGHGGTVIATSAPRHGTTFRILLPKADERKAEERNAPANLRAPTLLL